MKGPTMTSSRPYALRPYVLSAPAALLFCLFLLAPLASTAVLSTFSFDMTTGIQPIPSAENYKQVFTDSYFGWIFWRTLKISVCVTVLSVLIGAPEAYVISRMSIRWRSFFFLVAFGPLLISVVSRTLGWALVLGPTGIISKFLLATGLSKEPISLMFTEIGIIIALTHVLVPFVVISVWTSLQKLDPNVGNAAQSLGAPNRTILIRIVLPQVLPGIVSGAILVFSLAASAFATPQIIGGSSLKVVSSVAYDEFLNSLNWPLGAAVALVLLVAISTIVTVANRAVEKKFAQVF